jgi:hypothetical protein
MVPLPVVAGVPPKLTRMAGTGNGGCFRVMRDALADCRKHHTPQRVSPALDECDLCARNGPNSDAAPRRMNLGI